jgi:dihydrofolate reductase
MAVVRAIVAHSENRVIGSDGRIPWHLPADFRWFKRVTLGGVLVMGRKTFESIGRPLPGRETIVLTRTGTAPAGTRAVPSVTALDALLRDETRPVWVCGGGEIYRQLLPRCTDLMVTVIHRHVSGDAEFPPYDRDFRRLAEIHRCPEFHIEHWWRPSV